MNIFKKLFAPKKADLSLLIKLHFLTGQLKFCKTIGHIDSVRNSMSRMVTDKEYRNKHNLRHIESFNLTVSMIECHISGDYIQYERLNRQREGNSILNKITWQ